MHESELCAFAPLCEPLFQSRRFRDTHKVKLVKKRSKTNGVELGSSLLVPPGAQVLVISRAFRHVANTNSICSQIRKRPKNYICRSFFRWSAISQRLSGFLVSH